MTLARPSHQIPERLRNDQREEMEAVVLAYLRANGSRPLSEIRRTLGAVLSVPFSQLDRRRAGCRRPGRHAEGVALEADQRMRLARDLVLRGRRVRGG